MTDTILVRARNAAHIAVLKHPHGPPMTAEGALWPYDGFTCQLLTDETIERVEDKPAAAPAPAPADAPKIADMKLPPVPDPTAIHR